MLNEGVEEKTQKEEDTVDLSVPEEKLTTPFSLTELKQVWEAFVENETQSELVTVTLRRTITLKNSTEVHLSLANFIEIDELNKIKSALVNYLRKQLKNDAIDVIASVQETEEMTKKAYTNADKFQKMITKYPVVEELRKRLGLDPDH